MWLIKLHIAISILCLITFVGFGKAYKSVIKKNGWLDKPKKNPLYFLCFFVPMMNVLLVFGLFIEIGVTKEEYDNIVHSRRRENDKL